MPPVLDNDVEIHSHHRDHAGTDLVRTYLQNAGSKFFGIGGARREQPEPSSVHDLWDYLGDFA
jgi:hypothetical protein